jgi:hypothetical protein
MGSALAYVGSRMIASRLYASKCNIGFACGIAILP